MIDFENELKNELAGEAADLLAAQSKAIADKKTAASDRTSTMIKCLAPHVEKTLSKFCAMERDFAEAIVAACKKKETALEDAIKTVIGNVSGVSAMSDAEVYAEVVKAFMPGCEVKCTFKIYCPKEVDEDLFADFGALPKPEPNGKAIILDLFDTMKDEDEGGN